VEHTLQEGNACADVLAKMGALSDSPLVKLSLPPTDLDTSSHLYAGCSVFPGVVSLILFLFLFFLL
jgi:hypothetical protein